MAASGQRRDPPFTPPSLSHRDILRSVMHLFVAKDGTKTIGIVALSVGPIVVEISLIRDSFLGLNIK